MCVYVCVVHAYPGTRGLLVEKDISIAKIKTKVNKIVWILLNEAMKFMIDMQQ
jgi:hypothetical protein